MLTRFSAKQYLMLGTALTGVGAFVTPTAALADCLINATNDTVTCTTADTNGFQSSINLLTIEVRKSANHQPLEHDQHKLQALTDPHLWFAYWIGVFVTLGRKQVTMSEVYTGGVMDQALSIWFAERLKDAGLSAG